MEYVIERIGLPVRCHICKVLGFVKPRTDYGGWFRLKSLGRVLWYCPEHAAGGESRGNPPLGATASAPKQEDELEALMNII